MPHMRLACPNCGGVERLGVDSSMPVHHFADFWNVDGQIDVEYSGDSKDYADAAEDTGISCRACGWEGKEEELLRPDQVDAKRERGEMVA